MLSIYHANKQLMIKNLNNKHTKKCIIAMRSFFFGWRFKQVAFLYYEQDNKVAA